MFNNQNIPFAPTALDLTTKPNISLADSINVSTTDPSHLFWVPASYHPEIAPAEFEKHVLAIRTTVMDDDKVKRRRSALSVSFTANDGDMDQDSDKSQAIYNERGHLGSYLQTDSSFSDDSKTTLSGVGGREDGLQDSLDNTHRRQQHQQALSTLNRSNSLHSPENDDKHHHDQHTTLESQARKGRIRRSMSLQLLDKTTDSDKIPDFLVFDRHSAILDQSPVLVSKTNRPLSRRGARTKFRKTSTTTLASLKSTDVPPLPQQWSTDSLPDASSSLFDTGNIDNIDKDAKDTATTTTNDNQQNQPPEWQHNEDPEMDESVTSNIATVTSIQQFTTNDRNFNVSNTSLDSPTEQQPSPSPYPTAMPTKTDTNIRPLSELPIELHQSTVNASPSRERKSSWSWSFWTDGDKKTKNDKAISSSTVSTTILQPIDQENSDIDSKGLGNTSQPPMAESPANTSSKQRFGFSSLFSRKSSSSTPNVNTKLQKEKEKSVNSAITVVNAPPKDFQLNKMNHQRRLPIHTERAMYRLSHTKLANSKRPLRDQVIISNFMFWYLSIINSQQQRHQQQQQHQPLVTFPEQDGANNNNNNTSGPPSPSRQNMPRTPQQIITASRKKKRLPKKNHHHSTTSSQQQQKQLGGKPTTSYQKKRSSSLTSAAAASSLPRDKTGQHYIDKTSKTQTSTGFVVPENYLRPNTSDGQSKSKSQQRQHPGYTRSNSWSSDDDDDDEGDDLDDESDDDDDYASKDKGNKTHDSRNQRISPPPPHRPPSSNHHSCNDPRRKQQPPEQHPQHYLISASAT